MNGEWTYAGSEGNWEYESYDTKHEAIVAGRMEFEEDFLVGQLDGEDSELTYTVINIEEIE